VSTSAKIADPGTIGYRELPELSPEQAALQNQETRANALAVLQARKEILTVELSERGKTQPPAAPPASDEQQRFQREVERLKTAQQRLEDRDEWRQQKSTEFRAKYVDRPPPRYVPEKVVTRTEEAKSKKAQAKEEFLSELAANREAKTKRQEEKKSEGAARQAKAEAKSKKHGYTGRKS
jgi:DUF438 domain-containing protein